jgi:hypothetical protein
MNSGAVQMQDTQAYEVRCADLNSVRNRLFGGALVAFAVVAFGAYSFAAGDGPRPKPAQIQNASISEIRTTPDDRGHREMPPPVAPSSAK